MKFLFKMTLLALLGTSNFVFSLSIEEIENLYQTAEEHPIKSILNEIINSHNCKVLNTMSDSELDIAQHLLLLSGCMITPQAGIILAGQSRTGKTFTAEISDEIYKKRNECKQKILTTINELLNQNKPE